MLAGALRAASNGGEVAAADGTKTALARRARLRAARRRGWPGGRGGAVLLKLGRRSAPAGRRPRGRLAAWRHRAA
jgi:hypothetical protein